MKLYVLLMTAACGGSPAVAPASVAPPPPVAVQLPPVIVVVPDPTADTGFDVIVTPDGAQWRLDGELRTDPLPSRVRGIAPGRHTIQIDPPPGYAGVTKTVSLDAGLALVVDITLQVVAESLTMDMIRESLRGSRDAIAACGDEVAAVKRGEKSYVGKSATLAIEVGPDGMTTKVEVRKTDVPAVAQCIAGVVRVIHFPATRNGGSFNQPYVF
jgi:hypothetical protein